MARTIEIKVGANTREFDQKIGGVERRLKSTVDGNTASVNALRGAASELRGALTAFAGVAAFKQVAQFGIDLDRARNTMTALTGSIGAANAKMAELRELAKSSPGVTTGFATQLFNQLKALGGIGDETISRITKSLGKLNTVFAEVGPEFSRNLVQIFQQGFERSDIKEALGRVPIFEQLLESAFGTKDPDKLRQLKESGRITLGGFLDGFSNAVQTDPRFKNIQESLGGKLAKSFEETKLKLAELGERILRDLIPILDKLLPIINSILDIFSKLPASAQAAAFAIVTFSGTIADLTKTILALNAAGSTGLMARLLSGPVLLTATIVGATAVQTFREATGNQEMIDKIGGPDLNKITAIMKQRGVSGAEAFRQVAQELKDQGLLAGLPSPGTRQPLSGADAFQRFGTGPGPLSKEGVAAELNRIASTAKTAAEAQRMLREARAKNPALDRGIIELQRAERNLSTLQGLTDASKIDRAAKDAPDDLLFSARSRALDRRELEGLSEAQIKAAIPDLRERNEKLRDLREASEKAQEDHAKALAQDFRERTDSLREQRASRVQQTRASEGREIETLLRSARSDLTRSGRFIDAGVSRGQLTGGEAELLSQAANRELAGKLRQALALEEQRKEVNQANIEQLREEIELYDQLGASVSNTESFMRGFNSQIESTSDIFDRFGSSVARAFTNIKDLFNGLKSAVLGFFNDLLGQSLQNLVRNTLGGVFGNLSKSLGGMFGGAGGNVFRTPSTFGNFAQAFAGGGGGISAPPSISAGISQFFGSSVPRTAGAASGGIDDFFGAGVPRTAGKINFSLGALGKSFAGAAPLLGLGLGGGLGGQSVGGQILGSAGGLLAGGAVAGFSGALGATATAFFTNPFTIGIGAALLAGSFLFGKAKQRRSDEEASGQMLTSALQGIDQLAQAVSGGQVSSLSEARAVFENQILAQFISGINTLKTKSVRESRLTNQVRDLRQVFDARIPPLIAEQATRRQTAADASAADLARQQRNALTFSKLIPEFATGGTTRGGLAFVHDGEKILNMTQQARVRAMAGPDVFERAGVPGPSRNRNFDIGGTMPAGGAEPLVINLDVRVGVDAKGIVIAGASTEDGRKVILKQIQNSRTNKESF